MIKKPFNFLFKNYENAAEQLNVDLNLRPQNLSVENISKFVNYMKD